MKRHNFPNFTLLLLGAVLLSILNLPLISNGQNDPYTRCGALFSCGNLPAVGYPFWGGDRPEECGHPRLKLICENAETTIQMNNVKYRVLDMNWKTEILKISRIDLSQNLCLQERTSTTLDNEIFEYAAGYLNLTFNYGCSAFTFPATAFRFACAGEGSEYVELGTKLFWGVCRSSVVVPVSFVSFPKFKDLRELVWAGFAVRLKVDSSACRECENSSGRCGYDAAGKRTICFCQGRSAAEPKSCPAGNYSARASTTVVQSSGTH